MTLHGLIIDPQVDFCDPKNGTLFVPGADLDTTRLGAMIGRLTDRIDALHVTLDSHHRIDVAHPVWWRNASGMHPEPFTIISASEIQSGRWTTSNPEALSRSQAYVEALADNGRYPLCIWPYHCLIGSAGHAVMPCVLDALNEWEAKSFTPVDYVWKGSNIWTEHYSAIRADVPDPADPGTLPNRALLDSLQSASHIFVAGEAGSHCVANTVRDLASELGNEVLGRMTLITDATSPVRGFEGLQKDFLRDMMALGMKTAMSEDFLS